MRQDYRNYELRVILDSATDPARDVVDQVVGETGATNVRVSVISRKRMTCSPQCSALLEGVESLDPEVEAVSIVDGDVLTHPSWLRELVAPLSDPKVGAAHGNRWFLPQDAGWGSMVRYLWIAASVVPMYWFGMPWAGTFVIRRKVLESSDLKQKWGRSIVPDAPAPEALKQLDLRLEFVPSLMMINRERCGLAFCHDFMKRQMMWTKLYNPKFWPVIVHAAAATLTVVFMIGLIIAAAISGDVTALACAGGAVVLFIGTMLALVWLMESVIREIARRRGQTDLSAPWAFWLKLPAGIVLTFFVHASAVALATIRRRVTWRGVTYLVRKPFDVLIVSERPMTAEEQPPEANVSL
jgi:cellulose synthase/poly-beta-1,6-N-acetylglucosamine synthase-like glycosyltransferase